LKFLFFLKYKKEKDAFRWAVITQEPMQQHLIHHRAGVVASK